MAHQTAVQLYSFTNPCVKIPEDMQDYPKNFHASDVAIEIYGNFAIGDAKWCTEFAQDTMSSPYNVRFGNLQLIVEALEQGNNLDFINRNSIPGAFLLTAF